MVKNGEMSRSPHRSFTTPIFEPALLRKFEKTARFIFMKSSSYLVMELLPKLVSEQINNQVVNCESPYADEGCEPVFEVAA